MERRHIDCPETERREEIDFERTSCGAVIAGCSRFEPRCAVACSGACAGVLDRRDQGGIDDVDPRVLVVYAGTYGRTRAIAEALAVHLSSDRLTVELANADAPTVPPPADYAAVVIGSSVHHGRDPRSVIDYIVHHRDALSAMPAFFFSVGFDEALHCLWRVTGWLPTASAVFDAPVNESGLLRRFGSWFRPAAVSATDTHFAWPRVRDFALKIAEDIPAPDLLVTMESGGRHTYTLARSLLRP